MEILKIVEGRFARVSAVSTSLYCPLSRRRWTSDKSSKKSRDRLSSIDHERHDQPVRDRCRLNIREVLLEKMSHVRVEAFAIRHRCLGLRARPCALAFSPPRFIRKPAQGDAVPGIPGNT